MQINEFYAWFNDDSPNFTNQYGNIQNFYDKETDSFHIEDIQSAYEEFKNGETPSSLYFVWGDSK